MFGAGSGSTVWLNTTAMLIQIKSPGNAAVFQRKAPASGEVNHGMGPSMPDIASGLQAHVHPIVPKPSLANEAFFLL